MEGGLLTPGASPTLTATFSGHHLMHKRATPARHTQKHMHDAPETALTSGMDREERSEIFFTANFNFFAPLFSANIYKAKHIGPLLLSNMLWQ